MYLGDGLLFEIQNGKPKLIVLDHSVERNLVTNSLRTRPACLVSSGQPSCAQDVRAQRRAGRRPTGRRPGAPGGAETQAAESAASFGSGGAADTMRGGQAASKTRERRTKAAPEEKSERQKSSSSSVNGAAAQSAKSWATASDVKSEPTDPLDAEEPRDAAARSSGERPAGHDRRVTEERGASGQHVHRTVEEEAGGETEEGREGPDQTTTNNRNSPPKDNGSHGGVFGQLEQRNVDGASVEAKKAQWRQQLDEQVALQRQRCSTSVRPQTEQEPGSERSVHPPGRHREQPAAIRSSLRLGAVTPMEETLASQRREEQKRLWLEDLDRQREETSRRRMREKMLLSQKDDHELWAAHFDSLQRKAPAGTRAPPANPSLTWDASGRREAVSAGQVGVDPGGGRYPAKSSYHRSMTALLDPVQVEERERRRLKQLEQQRDIRAQVEEQRRHKRQEDATRRAEDREEESRVAQERDMLLGRFRREQRKQEQPKKLDDDDDVDGGVKEAVDVHVSRPTAAEKRDTAVQTDAPPTQAPSNCKNRAGKEDVQKVLAVEGGAAYEAFAGTEEKRRPEWNTRRPSRRFVPASERYPSPLQRSRRESRLKRQEEILGLQDRNCPPANRHQRRGRETRIVASRPRSDDAQSSSVSASAERGRSPLIPQPSLQFIPYIRTADVFHLDPTETEDTPTPHLHTAAPSCAPPPDASCSSSSSPADLLILRSTQRQQEILRGLAQLRQGLLEKQRELECDLRRQDDKRPSPAKC
ncbi:LOW QUALITY PROTEIN: coiled-coil domain-containing protein 66 [Phycodurus eques]|uniref:LOW QUALITY PROTEIN: coiled-coil domain-containing protein 66 n=1 Tax=Phycodurus eques TaxID=693459 RepID=UPI002ACD6FE6|nr:LOW QUALITY PROTEIN: coiled-coil domain-containing protein 66 [Phycodurus eques]